MCLVKKISMNIKKLLLGTAVASGVMIVAVASEPAFPVVNNVEAAVSVSVEIGFNVTYLLDVLSCMGGERFSLELTGPDASGLLREVGNQDSRYVVMPMRL